MTDQNVKEKLALDEKHDALYSQLQAILQNSGTQSSPSKCEQKPSWILPSFKVWMLLPMYSNFLFARSFADLMYKPWCGSSARLMIFSVRITFFVPFYRSFHHTFAMILLSSVVIFIMLSEWLQNNVKKRTSLALRKVFKFECQTCLLH